jgi:hypothetical protein
MQKNTNIKWTLEKIKAGFEAYYKEYGRYPTTHEVDAYHGLPSARQIQRRFGGLPTLRAQFKLTGPQDFTKGDYSSERARTIGKRAAKTEQAIYTYLVEHFGKPFVHREFLFNDDRRTRTDFFVYCKGADVKSAKSDNGGFLIDVFFPKDRFNFAGCLNSKMRTYVDATALTHPIIFLMMNPDISEQEIERYITNKKNKLMAHQHVMTFNQFKVFCEGKQALQAN